MALPNFFYADIESDFAFLNHYRLNEMIHANNGVVTSRLRGGLLTGCNIRFLFIRGFNMGYREEDLDYIKQGMFIFDPDLYFYVLDKYYEGGLAQVLMSPIHNVLEYDREWLKRLARQDFKELKDEVPVDVLNNRQWKRRVATVPGVDGKNSPMKGFTTQYWR